MTIPKYKSLTITFAAIDVANRPARKTGISFSTGDVKISIDGGSFTNTTNLPSEIGTTGRYSLALTAAELNGNNIHIYIENAAMDPVDYILQTGAQPAGTVVTDGGNSASSFKTSLTESTDSYWVDALILFTSGSLAGQIKKVTSYNGTTKIIGVGSAFTGTPSVGATFILINI